MADYVIGDIQGCLASLHTLLDAIGFDRQRDRLYFAGDLVNRGPESAATLRFIRGLGAAAETVLGNHDLYLLAVAAGVVRPKPVDTFHDVLAADDGPELLDWLRRRPLMLRAGDHAVVHAGLLPQWTAARALELAAEVSGTLASAAGDDFLHAMFGNQPDRWDDALTGHARLRVIVNAMTRLRVCDAHGTMEFSVKADPALAPPGFLPWFDIADRASRDEPVIFGHWSALGLIRRPNLIGLDSGCVWGRQLTALRLSDQALLQVECPCYSALTD